MKKFLAAISLMLVAVMVIAIPSVSATTAEEAFVIPEGINVYYATDVSDNTPTIDGQITDGEYGTKYTIEAPMALKNSDWGDTWEYGEYDETLASEYMDVYFAYDDEYVYFAFYEVGADATNTEDDDENTLNNIPFRSNYRFNFGFDLYNAANYIQTEAGNTIAWNSIHYVLNDAVKQNNTSITMSTMVEEFIAAKYKVEDSTIVAYGDLSTADGNSNYWAAQWALCTEFKFNRAAMAEVWNEFYGTSYEHISNAMWVGLVTNSFRFVTADREEPYDGQYFKWIGQNDITDNKADFATYGITAESYRVDIFDLVVFGNEGDDILLADPNPPVTEEATTVEVTSEEEVTTAPEATTTEAPKTEEPATEAPETEAEVTTEAPATEAPTTEAPKTEAPTTEVPAADEGGCGSTVSVAGLALVAALGTCTVFAAKKRD